MLIWIYWKNYPGVPLVLSQRPSNFRPPFNWRRAATLYSAWRVINSGQGSQPPPRFDAANASPSISSGSFTLPITNETFALLAADDPFDFQDSDFNGTFSLAWDDNDVRTSPRLLPPFF